MPRKLNRKQLIEIVKKICIVDYAIEEEYEQDLSIFLDNVPDPEASDLIFHHNPELSPEEIVDKALAYKPIILGPPSE